MYDKARSYAKVLLFGCPNSEGNVKHILNHDVCKLYFPQFHRINDNIFPFASKVAFQKLADKFPRTFI